MTCMHLQHSSKAIAIDCLVFELSKSIFRRHKLFDRFLKVANKCIIDEAGGVVGATSKSIDHHILHKV